METSEETPAPRRPEKLFRQHTIELVLRAEQAIAHHSEQLGNEGVLMRERVFLPNGRPTQVPLITGDTIRHGLREAAARATMQAAGLLEEDLTESALRLLFAGGQLRKDARAIDHADYDRMCDLFPPLALLGGCAGRIIPGQLDVGKGYLICEQTAHLMPEWVLEWMTEDGIQRNDARAHVEREQRTHMDPTLRPELRAMLEPGARAEVERRLLASDRARRDGDAIEARKHKSTNMPFGIETIAVGSLFFCRIFARTVNLLQHDTLHVMLAVWLQHASVGGRSATGHGLLRLVQCRGMVRVEAAPAQRNALAFGVVAPEVERFRAHVEDRSEELRAWLSQVLA